MEVVIVASGLATGVDEVAGGVRPDPEWGSILTPRQDGTAQ